MSTRTLPFTAAAALALLVAAPAVAAPAPNDQGSEPGASDPHRALDSDLPTDRPIVATVIEIDTDAGTVTLQTEHGNVALSVEPDVAQRLTVGDVVVVRFTEGDGDDFPSASPREPAPPAHERPRI